MSRPSDPNAKIKLLAAAESVFAEHGLDRAKVEEITARAGTSKGAFYLHFASKEDAFRQLIESFVARLKVYLERDADELAEGAYESIETYLNMCVEKDAEIMGFVWTNRGVMGLLLEGGTSASYRHLVDEFAERARSSTERRLAMGIERGLYRADLDLLVAAAFIAGAYDRLARQIVKMSKKPDLRTMLRNVQLLVLRGIATEAVLHTLDRRVTLPPNDAANDLPRAAGTGAR